MHIRRAKREEAELLTALTIRSKAYWDYDARFMADAEAELTFQPERFGPDFLVFVAEEDGRPIAFYSLIRLNQSTGELHDLFVEPEHIRCGIGTLLWQHAVDTARALKVRTLLLTADPHAEGFYLHRGALIVDFIHSAVRSDRCLPRMRYDLR